MTSLAQLTGVNMDEDSLNWFYRAAQLNHRPASEYLAKDLDTIFGGVASLLPILDPSRPRGERERWVIGMRRILSGGGGEEGASPGNHETLKRIL